MVSNNVELDGPLLVIGAGLGRTGTKSLKVALEILYGQPCYHMYEIIDKHKEHIQLWTNIFEKLEAAPETEFESTAFADIFKGYRMVTDHPACAIYQQLMRIYPEAKIILTVRDKNAWLSSARETVMPKIPLSKRFHWLTEFFTVGSGCFRMTHLALRGAVGFNVDFTDDRQLLDAFDRWNEEVKRTVPKDRLLVFSVKEGWGPLCSFLKLPIPNEPFPNVNDRKEMQARFKSLTQLDMAIKGATTVFTGICLGFIVYAVLEWRK